MRPILTMDFETDPFVYRKTVKPFAVGMYDGKDFRSIWSADCATRIVKQLDKLEPSVIYMHNGGRFDIFFLINHLAADMTIIGGRIVKANLGKHEIRDSYSILPFPLKQYKKDEIDMQKLRRECRESHRAEILSYLKGDCVYLHELVTGFQNEFGDFLTVGSAAMNELRKFHPFEKGNKYIDDKFRKSFFFGGRVQCFKSGILQIPFKVHDVNSMYPYVMKNYRHPIGKSFEIDKKIGPNTAFIVAEGRNYGAFPLRNRNGGIDFTVERGEFACTIHEWNAAEETRMFRPEKILKVYNFNEWTSFDSFVDHFYNSKAKFKLAGDKIREIAYKYVLNSAYGKFAQNPENYFDYCITHAEKMPAPWDEHFIHNGGEYVIWKKPIARYSYYHVCVGASITGAARAVLMHALAKSKDPIYCDTDSIISRELKGVNISDSELGAWKLEAQGNTIAIAGKKLYACFSNSLKHDVLELGSETCIKQATKGARISAEDIVIVSQGEEVVFRKDAPTFKLNGGVSWIERRIRKTV
jgi:hypothetical protein